MENSSEVSPDVMEQKLETNGTTNGSKVCTQLRCCFVISLQCIGVVELVFTHFSFRLRTNQSYRVQEESDSTEPEETPVESSKTKAPSEDVTEESVKEAE